MSLKTKRAGTFLLMAPAFLFSGSRDLLGLAAQAKETGNVVSAQATPLLEIDSSRELDPEVLEQAKAEAVQKLGLREWEKPVFTIENGRLMVVGKKSQRCGANRVVSIQPVMKTGCIKRRHAREYTETNEQP